jgi:hypothetical protein
MATVLRNTDPMASVVADVCNKLKAQVGAGSAVHLDKSEVTVTAADASSLATSLVLVNQLRAVYEFHKADTLAHKTADTATLSAPVATDLTSAITLANELKGDYNVHRASTSWHYNADGTNIVAASNASDQGTLNTLLNDIKAQFNAHFADGSSCPSIRLISP